MKQIDDDFIRTILEYIGSGRLGGYREVAVLTARLQSLPPVPKPLEAAQPANVSIVTEHDKTTRGRSVPDERRTKQ